MLRRKTPLKAKKIPPKRRSKKGPNSKYWRNKADGVWRELVCMLWSDRCAVCGATGRMEAHHLRTRSLRSSRHGLLNGILLCPSCHKFDSSLSAHKAPLAFADWLEKEHPDHYNYAVNTKKIISKAATYKETFDRLVQLKESALNASDPKQHLKDNI